MCVEREKKPGQRKSFGTAENKKKEKKPKKKSKIAPLCFFCRSLNIRAHAYMYTHTRSHTWQLNKNKKA